MVGQNCNPYGYFLMWNLTIVSRFWSPFSLFTTAISPTEYTPTHMTSHPHSSPSTRWPQRSSPKHQLLHPNIVASSFLILPNLFGWLFYIVYVILYCLMLYYTVLYYFNEYNIWIDYIFFWRNLISDIHNLNDKSIINYRVWGRTTIKIKNKR